MKKQLLFPLLLFLPFLNFAQSKIFSFSLTTSTELNFVDLHNQEQAYSFGTMKSKPSFGTSLRINFLEINFLEKLSLSSGIGIAHRAYKLEDLSTVDYSLIDIEIPGDPIFFGYDKRTISSHYTNLEIPIRLKVYLKKGEKSAHYMVFGSISQLPLLRKINTKVFIDDEKIEESTLTKKGLKMKTGVNLGFGIELASAKKYAWILEPTITLIKPEEDITGDLYYQKLSYARPKTIFQFAINAGVKF